MKWYRWLAWPAVAAFCALLLAGCGSATQDAPSGSPDAVDAVDPRGQKVIFWYPSDRHEETMLAMVDDFNATNEWGIIVQGEFAGSYEEIYDRILAGLPSGKVPDLCLAYRDQAAVYADEQIIVELSPYLESRRWGLDAEDREDFFPFVLDLGYLPQFEGLYGFPLDRSMELLYYNEDWLNEVGYDHPPATWPEFREMVCAAADAEAGTYGYALSVDAATFVDMLSNRGGTMIEGDTYTFDSEGGLEALDFLQQIVDEGCAVVEQRWGGDEADFAAGRVLFTVDSTLQMPEYRRAIASGAGFDWSVAAMPTALDTPTVSAQRANLFLLQTTPERQLAGWLFIRWLSEPEQQARWARASGHFPLRASSVEHLQDVLEEQPQYAAALDFLTYDVAAEPAVTGYELCRHAVEAALSSALEGSDGEQSLTQAVEVCNLSLTAFDE